MSTSSLNGERFTIADGKDSIVIVNCLGDIPGGRTLDVSGVAQGTEYIKAGHIIIKKSNGEYAPLGLSNGAYVTSLGDSTYAGVLKASVKVSDPRAAIMTIGQVNGAASPYPITSAIKTGLPHIEFLHV